MNQHLPASKVVSSAGVPKLPELVHETGKVLNQRGSVSDGEFNLPGVIAVPLDHTNRCGAGDSCAQPLVASYDDPAKGEKLAKGVVPVNAQSQRTNWKDYL